MTRYKQRRDCRSPAETPEIHPFSVTFSSTQPQSSRTQTDRETKLVIMNNIGKSAPPWTHAELAGMQCCQTGTSLVQAYVERFLESWNTEKYSKSLDEALRLGRQYHYPNDQVSDFVRNWLADLPAPKPAILSTKSFHIFIAPAASNCFELQVRAEFTWRASHGLYWPRTIHRHIIPFDCDSAPPCIRDATPVSEDASIEAGWTLHKEGGVILCGDQRHAAVYDPAWSSLSMERSSQKPLSQSMYGGPDRTSIQSRQDSGFCEMMVESSLMGTLALTAAAQTVSDLSSLPVQTDMLINDCRSISHLFLLTTLIRLTLEP